MPSPSLIARLARRGPRPQLTLAPLSRRLLASLITAVVGVALLATFLTAIGALAYAATRNRKVFRDGPLRNLVSSKIPEVRSRLQSPAAKLLLSVWQFRTNVLAKEKRRSPGYHMVGLRRVDARTGGKPSRRQEIIRAATRTVWRTTCRRVIADRKRPAAEELRRVQEQTIDARKLYGDDPEALRLARMKIYRENRVGSPIASLWPVAGRLLLGAAIDLPVVWRPLRQSIPDMLAGTVVVVERPRRRRR